MEYWRGVAARGREISRLKEVRSPGPRRKVKRMEGEACGREEEFVDEDKRWLSS